MTFCVDKSAKALKVEARWGQYKRETKEDQIDERTGRPKRVWKRYQRGGRITLRLEQGEPSRPQPVDDDFPNVYVKGQVRKRDHGIVVTLFLVNGQEELPGTKDKDSAFLFQPELIVSDPDGAAIFCKTADTKASANIDPATKLERGHDGDALSPPRRVRRGAWRRRPCRGVARIPDRAVRVSTR